MKKKFRTLDDYGFEEVELPRGIHAKGGGGGTTTVQNADPWKGAQPFLTDYMQQAKNQFNQPVQQYQGNRVAGFTQPTRDYFSMATDFGRSGQPYIDEAGSFLRGITDNGYDAYKNITPVMQDANRLAIDPALQAVNSQFAASGRFGSGMHQGQATEAATRALLPFLESDRARQYSGAEADISRRMDAARMLPGIQESYDMGRMRRFGNMRDIGAMQQGQNQNLINADMDRFNFAQMEPIERLQRYASLVSPGAGFGSSSSMSEQAKRSAAAQAAGGIGGAAAGSMAGYYLSGLNPLGFAAGGILGGLGGMF